MLLRAAGHEDSSNQALVQQIQKNKGQFLRSVRERWVGNTNRHSRASYS
jgi:hypothetical protein